MPRKRGQSGRRPVQRGLQHGRGRHGHQQTSVILDRRGVARGQGRSEDETTEDNVARVGEVEVEDHRRRTRQKASWEEQQLEPFLGSDGSLHREGKP